MSVEDKRAMSVFEESVQIVDGHYQVAIPWKNPSPCLPNNRVMAEHRLQHLKRRLAKNPDLRSKYSNFIDDLQIKGYTRKVPEDQISNSCGVVWYLPHHNVIHPKKPDKVRVVFDCAAKYRGESLNGNVLQGPNLTNSLIGVLISFRQEPVAVMADVEAMFHQVRVDLNDVDSLRFLWFPAGDIDAEPEEFQMLVHLFGGIWSPSCAAYALRKTAMDNTDKFDSDIIETVQRNFYVDDLLKSVKSSEDAIKIYTQTSMLLSFGGFHLTKWISNKRDVLDAIPQSELTKDLKKIDFETEKLPVERALGMQWNVERDKFLYNINIMDKPSTRKGMLSKISSNYDPLDFVFPLILRAKMLLQNLCRKKLGWDENIPAEDLIDWRKWLTELPTIEQFSIKRCIKPENFGDVTHTELHHFSDASEVGYGAVTYLKSVNNEGNIHCSFILGKSRLTPIKPVTIPRLELTAATVAVKLDKMVRRELDIPIDRSYFWTDSTSVLKYIKNENKRFQTFVANRLAVIHDGTNPNQWFYIDTVMNPADDASRGLTAAQLIKGARWIRGPDFIWKSDSYCEDNLQPILTFQKMILK